MFYSENVPRVAAKPALVEARYKITETQKEQLKSLEDRLNKEKKSWETFVDFVKQ